MNQLRDFLVFFISVTIVISCQFKKEKDTTDSSDTVKDKQFQVKSQPLKVDDGGLKLFLVEVKQAAQSKDENDLKEMINFPLLGQGDGFTDNFETFADLKNNGRVYSFFKESLAIAIEIKKDPDLGEKWYSIKYKYPQGRNDYYNYYMIDLVEGELKIIGIYIPGA